MKLLIKTKFLFTACLIAVLMVIIGQAILFDYFLSNASAEEETTSIYTEVLDDLLVDETFSIEDYPNKSYEEIISSNSPLLEIFQIAESSNGELILYVYQPTNAELDLIATSISMSCEYSNNGQNLSPQIYDLELVSTHEVFDKYVVKNFNITDEIYRYYNIIAIYRNFNSIIDETVSGGQEGNQEIAISVGQRWCTYYLNDTIVYEMGTFETLEIQVTYTGNFEFSSGIQFGNLVGNFTFGNSWFVCFDVEDYVIQHIYDADLSYKKRLKRENWVAFQGTTITYEDWSDDIYLTLTDNDVGSYDGGGLFSKKYIWNRISSCSDFLTNAKKQGVSISSDCEKQLNESQWCFAFLETESTHINGDGAYWKTAYEVGDITILRLHFVDINNKIYNLGVVGDRVTADNKSDGYGGLDLSEFYGFFENLFMIIGLILFLFILSYFSPIFKGLLNIIGTCFKYLFQAVWWIITAPLRLFKWLFSDKPKN